MTCMRQPQSIKLSLRLVAFVSMEILAYWVGYTIYLRFFSSDPIAIKNSVYIQLNQSSFSALAFFGLIYFGLTKRSKQVRFLYLCSSLFTSIFSVYALISSGVILSLFSFNAGTFILILYLLQLVLCQISALLPYDPLCEAYFSHTKNPVYMENTY